MFWQQPTAIDERVDGVKRDLEFIALLQQIVGVESSSIPTSIGER
jgi:hypothetical protein